MESEVASIPSVSSSSSPPDDDFHPDFSPVGSPNLTDSRSPQLPPSDQPPPPPLSDDLRDKIIKQVSHFIPSFSIFLFLTVLLNFFTLALVFLEL